jgi:Mobilization protein NikA
MARTSQSPKKFIISCRVSDREMRVLHQRAQESGLSITMLLRQSLDLAAQESRQALA